MSSYDLVQSLLNLVGYHARSVQPEFRFPLDVLVPQLLVCGICKGPVKANYNTCYDCMERARIYGDELADLVVPLSYAVKSNKGLQQFYFDLHRYKGEQPSQPALNRLKALVLLFRFHHLRCLERQVGMNVTSVVPVPSGRNRANHPLPEIARMLEGTVDGTSGIPMVNAQHVGQPRQGRAQSTDPAEFSFAQPLSGHVLILEDTWVKGHNAQSLAIQAKRHGAAKVSIVVLARMLDYAYSLTKDMVDAWQKDAHFDPVVCPVTGTSQDSVCCLEKQ